MGKVLVLGMISVCSVMVLALIDRYRLELLRQECDELRFEIESRTTQAQNFLVSAKPKVG
jgi:hypothetical protein